MIHFYTKDCEFPEIDKNLISIWIKQVSGSYEKKTGNINYIFCSSSEILNINNNFLNHNYLTDIITFDETRGNFISGDIFICAEVVKENAFENKEPFEKELNRVIIHGILHLCGQNDKTVTEKKQMTEKENIALDELNNL